MQELRPEPDNGWFLHHGVLAVPRNLIASDQTTEPAVFKDPKTARIRNYVNDGAKEVIEQRMREAEISGLEIVPVDPL